MSKLNFAAIYAEALNAGKVAATAVTPPTMVLGDADIFGKMKPNGNTYVVQEGVCGFAKVVIKPANSFFVNQLKKSGLRHVNNSYYGGAEFGISEYGQSMVRKECFAAAFAGVLQKYGINAYSESRMD